jgi:hypothetical protein
MTVPATKMLFHYTTLEGLTYILSSKTIRFSRLDKVNDVDEGASADYDKANTMVFASCWTSSNVERIDLWSLYSDFRGVRIGLSSDMFAQWNDLADNQKNALMLERRPAADAAPGSFKFARMYYALGNVRGPDEVNYVDSGQLPVRVFNPATKKYDLSELGLRKTKFWSFERESRFRLVAMLPDMAVQLDQGRWEWAENSPRRHVAPPTDIFTAQGFKNFPVVSEHLYAPLREDALQRLEITLGPSAEDAHHILISLLCKKYLGYLPVIRPSEVRLRKRP